MSYFYRISCSGDYKTWILLRPPRLSHNTLAAYTNIIHRCYSTVYDIRISLLLRPFFACFYQTLCSLYSRILTLLYRNHFAFASQQQQGLADPRVEIQVVESVSRQSVHTTNVSYVGMTPQHPMTEAKRKRHRSTRIYDEWRQTVVH